MNLNGASNCPHARNRFGASNGSRPCSSGLITAIRVISEELIEVVQISKRLGTDVRGVERAASDLVLASQLELTVEAAAVVRKRQETKIRLRIEHEIAGRIAFLETGAHDQSRSQLPIQFDIPADAARIAQAGRELR